MSRILAPINERPDTLKAMLESMGVSYTIEQATTWITNNMTPEGITFETVRNFLGNTSQGNPIPDGYIHEMAHRAGFETED